MATVLIIDDHEMVRAGIRYKLQSLVTVRVVGDAPNGLDGIRLAKTLNPDIIFMDIQMPGIDGIETTRKILAHNPGIKIIILSYVQDDPYPACLLKMGISAYLSKSDPASEILQAIRNVIAGKQYFSASITKQLALRNIRSQKNAISFDLLSLRELQIALQLIQGKEVKAIADIFYIDSKTVRFHRHQIFRKLKINNTASLILFARKLGYLKESILPL